MKYLQLKIFFKGVLQKIFEKEADLSNHNDDDDDATKKWFKKYEFFICILFLGYLLSLEEFDYFGMCDETVGRIEKYLKNVYINNYFLKLSITTKI